MRNAIQEYLNYSDEEKKDLWDHATFVFDTNVYLNLYRYTGKTREQLLSALSELKDRLWMPNHIAHEFMKHRAKVIIEINNHYDAFLNNVIGAVDKSYDPLHLDKEDSDMQELKTMIRKHIDRIKSKKVAVTNQEKDNILERLLSLYDGKVGSAFSEQEIAQIEGEGKDRYEKEIPPGYKDSVKKQEDNCNNMYGDLIFWKEILKYSASEKKDIILVTDDQKEDWWNIIHGCTIGPRIELKKEFADETKQRFYMYSMRSFITRFEDEQKRKIDSEVVKEIDYYSTIRHKRQNANTLYDYYESHDYNSKYFELIQNGNKLWIAKMRSEIDRLSRKNKKRLEEITALRAKYANTEMPKEIEFTISNTNSKYERDRKRIIELEHAIKNNILLNYYTYPTSGYENDEAE